MIGIEDHFDAYEDLDELIADARHQQALMGIARDLGLDYGTDSDMEMRYLNIWCPLEQIEAFLSQAERDEDIAFGGFTLRPEAPAELAWLKNCRWAEQFEVDDERVVKEVA